MRTGTREPKGSKFRFQTFKEKNIEIFLYYLDIGSKQFQTLSDVRWKSLTFYSSNLASIPRFRDRFIRSARRSIQQQRAYD